MDYELKANITTVVTFIVMPILASAGVDNITGNAMISILVLFICYALMYFNEKYLSGIFTKKGYDVVNTANQYSCDCEEEAINQEYR